MVLGRPLMSDGWTDSARGSPEADAMGYEGKCVVCREHVEDGHGYMGEWTRCATCCEKTRDCQHCRDYLAERRERFGQAIEQVQEITIVEPPSKSCTSTCHRDPHTMCFAPCCSRCGERDGEPIRLGKRRDCRCPCHQNPNVRHVVACCSG